MTKIVNSVDDCFVCKRNMFKVFKESKIKHKGDTVKFPYNQKNTLHICLECAKLELFLTYGSRESDAELLVKVGILKRTTKANRDLLWYKTTYERQNKDFYAYKSNKKENCDG